MERKIINIDSEKCNGCELCVNACHEGAIGMKDGKAVLLRDDYCDGLGDCLPVCPTGAISFVVRKALAYDEAAVQENMRKKAESDAKISKQDAPLRPAHFGGCPGSNARMLERKQAAFKSAAADTEAQSALRQWPVQIKLVPVNAPYFDGANLLIAADCAAYSYANFHGKFMEGKITIIGCPKLDMVDYTEKLTAIIRENDIKSVTAVRMEVPCCGGIENAVKNALMASGKFIPWQVYTLTTDGRVL